jgi:hypothetical protein
MLGKYYVTVLYFFKESTSHFFITFLLITIVVDIFILQVLNDMVYIVVVIIWIILLKAYHLKSNFSFILGLLLLCTALVFYQGYFLNITERASVWAYIFLVIATVQAVFEVKNKEAIL